MPWKSPVKTARICFYETGHVIDHYIDADSADAVDRVVAFLRASKAVIVDLEDFKEAEVMRLKSEEGRDGRSLFAATQCHERWDGTFRQRCAVVCPLREGD